MSGLDLLSMMPEVENQPKVVVMTSDQTPEMLLRALRERVYQYIAKPIEAKPHYWSWCARTRVGSRGASRQSKCFRRETALGGVTAASQQDRSVVKRVQSFLMRLESDLAFGRAKISDLRFANC